MGYEIELKVSLGIALSFHRFLLVTAVHLFLWVRKFGRKNDDRRERTGRRHTAGKKKRKETREYMEKRTQQGSVRIDKETQQGGDRVEREHREARLQQGSGR